MNKLYDANLKSTKFIKNIKNINKIKEKELKRLERKCEIEKILRDYKLDNIKPSLCSAYIKFGFPKIEEIISIIKKEQNTKEERLFKLITELKDRGLKYDENVPVYEEYIKCGGDLEIVIKEGEFELLLIQNTKYKHYLKHNSTQIARYLATIEFMNSDKKNDVINKFASKKNTINFC
jgi:hypothetical protein